MFNHSCDPNIRNRFNKTELAVYARRAIADGDEIFNCYGPNNKLELREERQEMLSEQYHFDCDCVPCHGNDEEYVSLSCGCCILTFLIECDFQLNSQTYLCPCGGDVVVVSEVKFWWREYDGDNPPTDITCRSCSSQLNFSWIIDFCDAILELDNAFDRIDCK